MKKSLLFVLLIGITFTLWELRGPLVNTMAWFGSREAVTASMEHAGLWGPAALFILFVLQVFLLLQQLVNCFHIFLEVLHVFRAAF